jgi:hypothetical protein
MNARFTVLRGQGGSGKFVFGLETKEDNMPWGPVASNKTENTDEAPKKREYQRL